MADLTAAGYAPRPSTMNFFLTPVTAPGELRRQLLEQRLVVRDCTSFGLPDYIRIAAQQPAPNALLVSAMAALAEHYAVAAEHATFAPIATAGSGHSTGGWNARGLTVRKTLVDPAEERFLGVELDQVARDRVDDAFADVGDAVTGAFQVVRHPG